MILFDASRNHLDCRFLKKDEVVASGESIRFGAHLVEIGEREGDRKPVADLRTRENKHNVVAEAGIKLEQGRVLSQIKLLEKVRCIFELPKYLVEVGGPYPSSGEGEGKSDDKDCLKKASNSNHSISSVEETKPGPCAFHSFGNHENFCSFDTMYCVCTCFKRHNSGTKKHDRAYASEKSSPSSCASHDAADEKRTRFEEPVLEQIEVCPSFDLGV
ncbi:hypothetical protein D8674_012041 [Pyrus ussuriensis x Pyrus communis]|uniref:Uncharacterized protein n=1 Tax=Pyrus ussuriensis x Pyrus communis TaxID=2448454 RepID=A0A5N5G0J5_9ROSA|nr:hypothetical protein D8674_012041 [Pyrus ussuriensis x Pyrus communis]